MTKPIKIDYYTDILCVWAWIAQRRVDELNKKLGNSIQLQHHYMDIFGNTAEKIQTQWGDRGSYQGFCEHVLHSAAPFKETPVNPLVWSKVRPSSSANPHLILKAVALAYNQETSINMALVLRRAFFVDAKDISHFSVLYDFLAQQQLDSQLIEQCIYQGTAIAALMKDYKQAKEQNIKGSPSYILDGGRQVLYGNVGYRIISTNIEELLSQETGEASWC